jgi:hypothetical protein
MVLSDNDPAAADQAPLSGRGTNVSYVREFNAGPRSSIGIALCLLRLTFLHEACFCGTCQFLTIAAYCLAFASISLAFLHEACFFAAPARGLPSFPTALLSQVSCAIAEPSANIEIKMAIKDLFIVVSFHVITA